MTEANRTPTDPAPTICQNDTGTCQECGHGCPCACKGCPGCCWANPDLPDLDTPPPAAAAEPRKNNPVFCSFCAKDQKHVKAIVSGPLVYICSECWEQCGDIMAEAFGVPPEALYGYLKTKRLEGMKAALEAMAAQVSATGGPVVVGPADPSG